MKLHIMIRNVQVSLPVERLSCRGIPLSRRDPYGRRVVLKDIGQTV